MLGLDSSPIPLCARAMTIRSETSCFRSNQTAAPVLFGAATTDDLARLAGVSKKTVYRVLNDSPLVNDATRGKVNRLIGLLGYSPDPFARALASQRSRLIGMIIDDSTAEFVMELQHGALDQLRSCGFELVVHSCDSRLPGYIEGVRRFVQQQKVHGLILVPKASEDADLLQMLDGIGCDYVRIATRASGKSGRTLMTQDREGGAEVARFLFTRGHRDVAVITGPSHQLSTIERTGGFLETLRLRCVDVSVQRIVEGDYTFESGVRAAEQLLRSPASTITAIFCQNDEMAAGAYKVAFEMGLRIPDQISIIGYDDSSLAEQLSPALTSVRRDARDTGRRAATMLTEPEVLSSSNDGSRPSLIVRDSCKRIIG